MSKVMGFSGELEKAFQDAERFAGEGGRIATLPDLLALRTKTVDQVQFGLSGPAPVWDMYYHTRSAEYAGLTRSGVPVTIVAHGVGPLSTLEGMQQAFDKKGLHYRGGRVSNEEFWKLESGAYGEVTVIPLQDVWAEEDSRPGLRGYPFFDSYGKDGVLASPLWSARLGSNAEAYLSAHEALNKRWAQENQHNDRVNPQILLEMGGPSNCSYHARKIMDYHLNDAPGMSIAHPLCIDQLMRVHQDGGLNLRSSVSPAESMDYVRFMAIQKETDVSVEVSRGFVEYKALLVNPATLQKLWRAPKDTEYLKSPFMLTRYGEHYFTSPVHEGHAMEGAIPQYQAHDVKLLRAQNFVTDVQGYYGFFRYDPKEVWKLAPLGANCFSIENPQIVPHTDAKKHEATVMFYKVAVDIERVLKTEQEVSDYETRMDLTTTFRKTSALMGKTIKTTSEDVGGGV